MAEKEKIVVAMSGGVDSSVAAALLVEAGYSVTGMMLNLWSDECDEAENACCPPEAIDQARQVANIIGIPFYVIDARDVFKHQVVDAFIEGYSQGITPNPCFFCNNKVRWGFFLDRILDSRAEKIATGHYARIEEKNGLYFLKKGIDTTKDQSYILSGLNQFQLAHTTFPLGDLHKTEVRKLAKKFNLPVADKQDSQDLCFVGKEGYRDFLKRYIPQSFIPGSIKDNSGKKIGAHGGLANYTIGQRKGLGAGFSEPVYVIEKKSETNEVIIGHSAALGKVKFFVENPNWISGIPPQVPFACELKIRYKSSYINAKLISITKETTEVQLGFPARDITPGQIAGFYQGDFVIGSGIIKNTTVEGGQ